MNTNIQHLLTGPKYPDKEFIRCGRSFAEIYALAANIQASLDNPEFMGSALCMATDDKSLIAAALLAALASGQSLLLPFALSDRVLERLHNSTGFTVALAGNNKKLPRGVAVVHLQELDSGRTLASRHFSPDQELLKIYTGGSTGSPQVWTKTGVNVFAEGLLLADHFGVGKKDCILATIPPYHIYGLLFSVVLPLVSGATVISNTPSLPGEISEVLHKEQATILASVPAHYHALRQQSCSHPNLTQAFSSAGMLDPVDNSNFCTHYQTGITEVYGSTETGGIACRNRSLGEEHFTPLPTVSWKVKDDRLAVHSPYVSPGLPLDTDGFFITGDRITTHGLNAFSLKGRVDGITKVGGKRVDLEEIRALIIKMETVVDCVVMALPDTGASEHRIGALVSGESVNIQGIKKILSKSLEPYALPRRIKVIDRIPILANGKYDRLTIGKILVK